MGKKNHGCPGFNVSTGCINYELQTTPKSEFHGEFVIPQFLGAETTSNPMKFPNLNMDSRLCEKNNHMVKFVRLRFCYKNISSKRGRKMYKLWLNPPVFRDVFFSGDLFFEMFTPQTFNELIPKIAIYLFKRRYLLPSHHFGARPPSGARKKLGVTGQKMVGRFRSDGHKGVEVESNFGCRKTRGPFFLGAISM